MLDAGGDLKYYFTIEETTPIFLEDLINWGYHMQSPWLCWKCVRLAVSLVSTEWISKDLKHLFVPYLLLFHLPWNGNCKCFDSWIRMQFNFNCCGPGMMLWKLPHQQILPDPPVPPPPPASPAAALHLWWEDAGKLVLLLVMDLWCSCSRFCCLFFKLYCLTYLDYILGPTWNWRKLCSVLTAAEDPPFYWFRLL